MGANRFFCSDLCLTISDFSETYWRNQATDCVLYANDGTEFKIHKAIFCQTEFQRKLLTCSKEQCCGNLNVSCPLSKDELEHLVFFLYTGKINFNNKCDSLKIIENLDKVFGYDPEKLENLNCNEFETIPREKEVSEDSCDNTRMPERCSEDTTNKSEPVKNEF